jgi:hypothetical protein
MYKKKPQKINLVENTDEVNTPIQLFSKVPTNLIQPPIRLNDEDIITVDPEVDKRMMDCDIKDQEIRDEIELEEIEKDWEVVEDLPDFTPIQKQLKTKKRDRTIQKYIALRVGKDGKRLIDRIIEQAFYCWDTTIDVKPRYSDETVRFSQKLLFEWGYSKPAVKEEKVLEVTVEHKLDQALKQIHENRKRVKLLN